MDETGIQTAIIEANGLQFEVDMCGSGEKFALLLHGFPESKFSWRAQLPLLAELGYTAWAPNLRGYGRTSRPTGIAKYRLRELVSDVEGLIAAAEKRGHSGPTTLIAHDWGGIMAWYYAALHPTTLERLITLNIPHPEGYRRAVSRRKGLRQLLKSWYIFFFQIPWLPEKMLGARGAEAIGKAFYNMAVDKSRFPEEVLEEYRRSARAPGALTAMINYYRALLRYRDYPELWNTTEKLDVPTLMIWGEEDTALDKSTTFGTEALVEDFTLRYLPGVSHWVQQEAPETVNAMIHAWLTGQMVPEAGPAGQMLSSNASANILALQK